MSIVRQIGRYAREEAGTILVFWGMMLAVLLGLVAMSFDMGRIASTQSELQSFADSVALAAAGELDGGDGDPNAIERARAAAATVTRRQTFAEGGPDLTDADYELTFYETLPSTDGRFGDALAGGTSDPKLARYVQVNLNLTPRTVVMPFAAALRSLIGAEGGNTTQVGAVAVAGFTMFACDITPLMFCVPGGWEANANRGQMILLRSGGQGAAWGPGNFGFLKPEENAIDEGGGPCSGLSGVQLDACLISAEDAVTACFRQDGVDTEPGQKVGIEDAIFNVRFDMYQSIMNGNRNNPAYRPAPNVVKGVVPKGGGQCVGTNGEPSPDTMAMPRDSAFDSNRFGNGNWDRADDPVTGDPGYLTKNHDGVDPTTSDGFSVGHPLRGTRYEMFRAEIAAAGGGAILPAGRAETGLAQCSQVPASPDPDRRVVIAAAIDCDANPISGRETGVPVQEFVRLFMTEPVGNSGTNSVDIYVEVLGSAGGGGGGGGNNGSFHEVVQLYR